MDNRVVWSEGIFLSPHHFQQQERYFENTLNQRVSVTSPFQWGFRRLVIDPDALLMGQVSVSEARGILADGTVFNLPQNDPVPAVLDLSEQKQLAGKRIFLAVPSVQNNKALVNKRLDSQDSFRYNRFDLELMDYNEGDRSAESVELASLNMKLLVEGENGADDGHVRLPIAKIKESTSNGSLILDETFIPPLIDIKANNHLLSAVKQLISTVSVRATTLSERVVNVSQGGSNTIQNFLLLQLFNRYEGLFKHFISLPFIHPELIYRLLVQFEGELATYYSASRRCDSSLIYRHDDLSQTFKIIDAVLKDYLSAVIEEAASPITIEERRYGIKVATVHDKKLFDQAIFVLAVKADIPVEDLRAQFPKQTKIGTVENIRNLVNNQLPGISITSLPVAPREIPIKRDFQYFQLDPNSPHWKSLGASGGIAFHLSGEFPELELEFWAVRK
ncbi:type VI secretion system baseplate subunit TssK [Kangiella shandongensis]|uniref:type VI secretion system baseplate subunit TssK n=1 Tax=Kangiella shandongensis TaxID=2763258 RepID=UPI001CBF9FA0|nr:type VI secretion system baseplate subunit TssK [Kangiella shandongensis]